MRQVISLSLSPKAVRILNRNTRRFGFASKSKYIQNFLEADEHVITEEEVLKEWAQANHDSRSGKTRTAKSLRVATV